MGYSRPEKGVGLKKLKMSGDRKFNFVLLSKPLLVYNMASNMAG